MRSFTAGIGNNRRQIFMQNINTKTLELKWEESKRKINILLIKEDINTITMMKFYKLYISSPFDLVTKSLFEYSFNDWYNQNMKGESIC